MIFDGIWRMRLQFHVFAAAIGLQAIPANALPAPSHVEGVQKSMDVMPERRFWSLIEQSHSQDPDQQIELLRASLSKLSPEDLEAFEARFDDLMKRSYRWDVWGAAYVAMGGASDDGFEYFRLWLIARGQKAFEDVLADPDKLAEIAPDNPELLEFEALAHIAPDVWAAKTGRRWDDMPRLASYFSPVGYGMPAGEEFSEEPGELAKRYPKLWQRFGVAGH